MELHHEFTVPVGISDAWRVLLDAEQVVGCMPGATLDAVDGDRFTGSVRVKVGPVALTYHGQATFAEKDEAAFRARIDAQGRDTRGGGRAGARVTATLIPAGDTSTRVDVRTELEVTGRAAQFGRSVMIDVGNRMLGQFADCLAGKLTVSREVTEVPVTASAFGSATISADDAAAADLTVVVPAPPAAPWTPPTGGRPAETASGGAEPIDLMASLGPAVARRLALVAAAVAVMTIAAILRGRRRKSG